MPTYKLTAKGNAEIKKTWVLTVLLSYAAILLVFGYNLLYRGGHARDMAYFALIISALAGAYFFGQKKYFMVTDSTRLIVDEDKITLHVFNSPDVTIEYRNVLKITQRKQGFFLVNRNPRKKSLLVINKFEDYNEIEKLVAQKVNAGSPLQVVAQ